jgi:hypothetical protein
MVGGMSDVDTAKREINLLCRDIMRSKKARISERLQAATLRAGILGLYGPGRPKVMRDKDEEPKESSEGAKPAADLRKPAGEPNEINNPAKSGTDGRKPGQTPLERIWAITRGDALE